MPTDTFSIKSDELLRATRIGINEQIHYNFRSAGSPAPTIWPEIYAFNLPGTLAAATGVVPVQLTFGNSFNGYIRIYSGDVMARVTAVRERGGHSLTVDYWELNANFWARIKYGGQTLELKPLGPYYPLNKIEHISIPRSNLQLINRNPWSTGRTLYPLTINVDVIANTPGAYIVCNQGTEANELDINVSVFTPSVTQTATPTITPTRTPANTPTQTPSRTPRPTSTPTRTPTQTLLPPSATPSSTPASTPQQTLVPPSATPSSTPAVTPSPTAVGISRPAAGTTVANADWTLYRPAFFPIYTLFRNGNGMPQALIDDIKAAVDRWSRILSPTVLPDTDMPAVLINLKGDSFNNPLLFKNNGLVLVIDRETMSKASTIAAAGITMRRLYLNPGTTIYGLPSAAAYSTNIAMENWSRTTTTALGRTAAYWTALHEIGHALGIGTNWFMPDPFKLSNTSLILQQNFIVTGNDNTPNLSYGVGGNIFYSTLSGPLTAGAAAADSTGLPMDIFPKGSFITSITRSCAKAFHTYAKIDPDRVDTTGTMSYAVEEYQNTYRTGVSAIPLENNMSLGSYGAHWFEGWPDFDFNTNIIGTVNPKADPREHTGLDRRVCMVNNTAYAAPALFDELMTASTPGVFDTPISRITLGALRDLGWSVDMAQADPFDPYLFELFPPNATGIPVKKYGFGGVNSTNLHYAIRRGINYTIKNSTGIANSQLRFRLGNKVGNAFVERAILPANRVVSALGNAVTINLPDATTDTVLIITTGTKSAVITIV